LTYSEEELEDEENPDEMANEFSNIAQGERIKRIRITKSFLDEIRNADTFERFLQSE